MEEIKTLEEYNQAIYKQSFIKDLIDSNPQLELPRLKGEVLRLGKLITGWELKYPIKPEPTFTLQQLL